MNIAYGFGWTHMYVHALLGDSIFSSVEILSVSLFFSV